MAASQLEDDTILTEVTMWRFDPNEGKSIDGFKYAAAPSERKAP
jgi:hypothetical protein